MERATTNGGHRFGARVYEAVKEYGSGETAVRALDGVTVGFPHGAFTAIMGPSGSGKSTLMQCAAGLDRLNHGRVFIGDTELTKLNERDLTLLRRERVGFVFQQFNLLPGRTALENVAAPLMYASGRQFWRRRSLAAQMLDRVGLGDRLDTMPEKLSGGEQQRVAIARALVRGPRVILADEPTGALDVETGQEVMDLLDEVASSTGAALVTITHDLAVAARAQRHYRLTEGVLVPVDLHGAAHEWVGDVPTLPGARRLPGATSGIPELGPSVPAQVER